VGDYKSTGQRKTYALHTNDVCNDRTTNIDNGEATARRQQGDGDVKTIGYGASAGEAD
jgi:hypothetical protein